MISLFIDPNIFACPNPEEGQDKYENFIATLLDWQQLSKCEWAKTFISSKTCATLHETGKYPLWNDLEEADVFFSIDYIAPDLVMKIINSFINKFSLIEEYLGIEIMDYNLFESIPAISKFSNEGPLDLVLEDLMVCMILKCRLKRDSPVDQILVTRPVQEDVLNVSFTLNDILFSEAGEIIYLQHKPINEKEEFNLYLSYDHLASIKNISIPKSSVSYEKKTIKLSGDHHGNNLLEEFAKKLFKSEYVTSVINNLPNNSYTTNFIFKIYANGMIDLYLTTSDEGYGMTIQTSGTSYNETHAIAQELNRIYSSQQ